MTNAPNSETEAKTGPLVDAAKAAKLAQQIVGILANEESITRQRAIHAAMTLLGEAIPPPVTNQTRLPHDTGVDSHDLASFFNRDGEMKPADYAYLCAAYYFAEYGAVPFSIAEIRVIAKDAGVVIPDRLDMTFASAAKKGKKLFQSPGRGTFKPTATGSLEFGERWTVRPGRKPKPSSTEA
ncbi:MAG TPA: hypothetical protein VJ476_04450 [Rhizomicrobium sp.]|nr:hypothetical protein [Rhizomicrobium sp.]